jgi:TonB-dependent SusC/RagA subfamily outer membrane receptor
LIIVDGKEYTDDINSIEVKEIVMIEVLKDQTANALYGKKGDNGVVLITTKKIIPKGANDEVFVVVEDMPMFKGGQTALDSYLKQKTSGVKDKGVVSVRFTVNADGRVSNVKAVSVTPKALVKKAEEIVAGMPAWNAGKQRGMPVSVDMEIKIEF